MKSRPLIILLLVTCTCGLAHQAAAQPAEDPRFMDFWGIFRAGVLIENILVVTDNMQFPFVSLHRRDSTQERRTMSLAEYSTAGHAATFTQDVAAAYRAMDVPGATSVKSLDKNVASLSCEWRAMAPDVHAPAGADRCILLTLTWQFRDKARPPLIVTQHFALLQGRYRYYAIETTGT